MPGLDVFISDPWAFPPLLHSTDIKAIVHGDPERGALHCLRER